MSASVVDASVVARCLVPGPGRAEARALMAGMRTIIAPALVYPECGSAIWKQARRDALSTERVDELLGDLMRFPLMTIPLRHLTAAALRLAVKHRHSIYDCFYIATAMTRDCGLVTADRRLAQLAREIGLNQVVLVEPSPA